MREIKFRGKRIDNGEWVFGFYWVEECRNRNAYHIYTYEKDKDTNLIRITGNFEVIPETVGQYTGLKDKNGVEIYEGDILNVVCRLDSAMMRVEWEGAQFVLKTNDGIGYKYLSDMLNVEVIGNIHDAKDGNE